MHGYTESVQLDNSWVGARNEWESWTSYINILLTIKLDYTRDCIAIYSWH